MSGRRGYERYGVSNAAGTLRVLRSVTVRQGADDEYIAMSGEPAGRGEVLTLERIVDGVVISATVCVIESRPAVVRGSVRHRLRLKPVGGRDRRDGTVWATKR